MGSDHGVGGILRVLFVFLLVHCVVGVEPVVLLLSIHKCYVIGPVMAIGSIRRRRNRPVHRL